MQSLLVHLWSNMHTQCASRLDLTKQHTCRSRNERSRITGAYIYIWRLRFRFTSVTFPLHAARAANTTTPPRAESAQQSFPLRGERMRRSAISSRSPGEMKETQRESGETQREQRESQSQLMGKIKPRGNSFRNKATEGLNQGEDPVFFAETCWPSAKI